MNSLDFILQDIVEIFNLQEVELVRLSGLLARQQRIEHEITPQWLHIAINKLKKENVINYSVSCFCPHCKEIFYIKTPIVQHTCDTCGIKFNINFLNLITNNNIDPIVNGEQLALQLNNEQTSKKRLEERLNKQHSKGQIVNAKEMKELDAEMKEKSKKSFEERFKIL